MAEHVIVVRSGPTAYELEGRIRGTLDVPLAPEGVAAADRAAAELAAIRNGRTIASLSTATDVASTETAAVIARSLGLKPRPVPGLDNLDQGLWQGLRVEDIRQKQPRLHRQWQENPWSIAPPEGESLDEACDRLGEALEKVVRRHAGLVAVVVPPPLDRLVHWLVSGEAPVDLWTPTTGPMVSTLPLEAQWRPDRRPVPVG
jgi:broad specificity phosphatase PhoE